MAYSFPDKLTNRKSDMALVRNFGKRWSDAINNLAKVLDVPVAIIFKKETDEIQIISTNQDERNPFNVGDTIPLEDSFCNFVFERDSEFRVHDYREIDLDINNVATQNDFISYLGYPLKWPDGELFGTICLLDDNRNYYSGATSLFLKNFRDLLSDSLALVEHNYALDTEINNLEMQLQSNTLPPGSLPFCPHCNKIYIDGTWITIDRFKPDSLVEYLNINDPSFCDVHRSN